MLRNVVRQAGLGEMIIGAGAAPNDMTKAAWWGGGVSYNFTGLYCAVDHDDPEYMGQVLPWKNESDYVRENRVAHAQAHGIPFVPMVVSGWDPRKTPRHLSREFCAWTYAGSVVCVRGRAVARAAGQLFLPHGHRVGGRADYGQGAASAWRHSESRLPAALRRAAACLQYLCVE